MGSWTITKWELKNTLNSKKFLFIFFFQLVVLLMMILFFNNFLAGLESEQEIALSPSLDQFASLGVYDPQNILTPQLNPQILELIPLDSEVEFKGLQNGEFTGKVFLSTDEIFQAEVIEPIPMQLYLDYQDPKRNVIREEVILAQDKSSSLISQIWINDLFPKDEISTPQIEEEVQGEDISLQIIRKLMTAILTFLPLFLFGNLIVDTIVGEKERKTGEMLIAMPLSRGNIILGKSMAVIITMAFQLALWMALMILAGFSLENPLVVYLIVVSTAIPMVGVTGIVASFAKNYKEAGIGITFAYIAIITFLIVPALAYISQPVEILSLSSMTLVIKIVSQDPLSRGDIILPFASIIFLSIIFYYSSIWLFKRDDILFGPRPGIIRLLLDFIGLNKILDFFNHKYKLYK